MNYSCCKMSHFERKSRLGAFQIVVIFNLMNQRSSWDPYQLKYRIKFPAFGSRALVARDPPVGHLLQWRSQLHLANRSSPMIQEKHHFDRFRKGEQILRHWRQWPMNRCKLRYKLHVAEAAKLLETFSTLKTPRKNCFQASTKSSNPPTTPPACIFAAFRFR